MYSPISDVSDSQEQVTKYRKYSHKDHKHDRHNESRRSDKVHRRRDESYRETRERSKSTKESHKHKKSKKSPKHHHHSKHKTKDRHRDQRDKQSKTKTKLEKTESLLSPSLSPQTPPIPLEITEKSGCESLIAEILQTAKSKLSLNRVEESTYPSPSYTPPVPKLPEEIAISDEVEVEVVEVFTETPQPVPPPPEIKSESPEKVKTTKIIHKVLELPMPPIIVDPARNRISSKFGTSRPTIIQKSHVCTSRDLPVRTLSSFEIIEMVGEGSYGKVFRAQDLVSNQIVALKYVRMEREYEGFPITAVREINLLRRLEHPNIVTLNEIVYNSEKKDFAIYLSFEYMNHDLLGVLKNRNIVLEEDMIYSIFKQILEGIQFSHSLNIIHRDLKCSNILLDNRGTVKVADWGLGREWFGGRPFTNKVSSLWYRAIELLLGEECYTTAIDMWSLGCIFAELFLRSPLFPYNSEVQIVQQIFELCGHPNNDSWPEAKKLKYFRNFVRRDTKMIYSKLRETFSQKIQPLALSLLEKMLCLNPAKRLTAEDALKSHWIVFMNLKKSSTPMQMLASEDCHEMLKNKKNIQ